MVEPVMLLVNHLEFNEMPKVKSCMGFTKESNVHFKQILEAALHTTAVVGSFISHLTIH